MWERVVTLNKLLKLDKISKISMLLHLNLQFEHLKSSFPFNQILTIWNSQYRHLTQLRSNLLKF